MKRKSWGISPKVVVEWNKGDIVDVSRLITGYGRMVG